jgi:cytoskeletal protein CcmA (bactofilin family)
MRAFALTALAALSLAAPTAARAQDPGALPADLAHRVTEILNDSETRRYEGSAEIESGDVIEGDVAVLDGSLSLDGRVEGDVVVVNGGLALGPDAEITGDVIVVGGDITGQDEATVDGEMVVFAEPVTTCRRGRAVDVTGDCSRLAAADEQNAPVDIGIERGVENGDWGLDDEDDRGRAQFVVAAGRSYNRVEGLPIRFGPAVETGGSNPLRVRALAIFRTEDGGELGPERWGYDARIEQFFGGARAFRVGGRAYSVIDPIEAWHLTDLENSLSTFFLHQDFRDHYQRRGWTAFATLAPRESPLSATVEFREERHTSVAPGSPWSLFDNSEPWRPQPLAGEGRLSAVAAIGEIDSRSETRDPASGWYVRAEVEQALRSTLTRPEANAGTAFVVPAQLYDGKWLAGTVDVRRYNRISPSSRLNLRLAGGASLNGEPLPPQRQHALGGEGTLPGFPLYGLDCGARLTPVSKGLTGTAGNFYPRYGCDSFALFQAEYRGDVSFRLDLGGWGEGDDEYGDEDEGGAYERIIDADFGWVFFVDAGAGWSTESDSYDEETAVDVGAGILVGDLGIYFAIPVADGRERGGLNFFIRLAPRF